MSEIVAALILPSNLGFLLLVAGVILCMRSGSRPVGLISFTLAALILVTFSTGKTATFLLSQLEYEYPRAPDNAAVGAIVVLAAYAADDSNMSLSDRPNHAALYRVVESALLWQHCADCVIVVSGRSPTTNIMRELLESIGVPSGRIHLDNDAANTAASAANVHNLLGDTAFYLVTSAGHMPRSMAVFAKAGMQPIAAPTDHRLPKNVAQAGWTLSPFHLECSDLAIHEIIGLWWYRIHGWA